MTQDVLAIGLDVGGTKIAGGLVRFPDGSVVAREVVPTLPARGPEAVLASAVAVASRLAAQARARGREPLGLGIAVPELVDPQGRITSGATIDWRGVALRDWFAAAGPLFVESDIRAAASAEAHFGAGRDYRDFVYVSVGTGISSCLVQDARPYAGARGNALVLGSGSIVAQCPACNARVETVLEEIASGPGLVKRYVEQCPGGAATAEDVLAAAAAGNAAAIRVVRHSGEALGNRVAFVANLLDPEAIIVGGGLGLAGGLYWQSFCDAARAAIWAEETRGLPILRSALAADVGIVGAALLGWRQSRTSHAGSMHPPREGPPTGPVPVD